MPEQDVIEPTGGGEAPEGAAPSQEEPDALALLEDERAARGKLEEELRSAKADADGRLGGLEKAIEYVFASNQPPPAPAPKPITADDFADDPSKAAEALADRKVQAALAQRDREYSQRFNALSTHAFNNELSGLKSRKFYGEVEEDLDKYFKDRPDEMTPGRAEEVYNYLVGKKSEQLDLRHQADEPGARRPIHSGGPSPSPPVVDTDEPKKALSFADEDEAYVAARFTEEGFEMTPEENEKFQSPRFQRRKV